MEERENLVFKGEIHASTYRGRENMIRYTGWMRANFMDSSTW
jgi:hypothetical protein